LTKRWHNKVPGYVPKLNWNYIKMQLRGSKRFFDVGKPQGSNNSSFRQQSQESVVWYTPYAMFAGKTDIFTKFVILISKKTRLTPEEASTNNTTSKHMKSIS